jgi:chorismate synthase
MELNRRRPGQNSITTPRNEADEFEIISGINNGQTTGAPICLMIHNTDTRSKDYEKHRNLPRPSQIDYPALLRFGSNVDLRGSGIFSGRLTAGIVMAGAIAKDILTTKGIQIGAFVSQIGSIIDNQDYSVKEIKSKVELTPVRAINSELAEKMFKLIENVKTDQDSIGGCVKVRIENFPSGVGDPWFHSLESDIAAAMLSIPATRGIEFGTGFKAAEMKGSEHNDPYQIQNGVITTVTNHAGGIVGGISIGTPITFRIPIKPTASIGKKQNTVNLTDKSNDSIEIEGRHDPCIVPRVLVAIEAMTAIVLLDHLLCSKSNDL